MRLLWILLLLPVLLLAQSPLTPRQIQAKLNILNGAAAECVMHRFYADSGWIRIEGEVGRNGIDGKKHSIAEYRRIEALVEGEQYRARLFRLKPKGGDAIEITIYKIKNKGDRAFETFLESRLRPIVLGSPRNAFESRVAEAYNRCRRAGLHRYFPSLSETAVETLLGSNYLKAKTLLPYL